MQLEWVKMGFLLLFEMIFISATKGTLVAEIQCDLVILDMNNDILFLLQMRFAPASEKWLLQLEVLQTFYLIIL